MGAATAVAAAAAVNVAMGVADPLRAAAPQPIEARSIAPLRPTDLPGAVVSPRVDPAVHHTVSHSVRFAPSAHGASTLAGHGGLGGVSAYGGRTLGGIMGMGATMGGLDASAFGASALHMLARSSTEFSHVGGGHHSHHVPVVGESLSEGFRSLAHHPQAHLIAPEVHTQHLAAGLYSQLDHFYMQRAGPEPILEQQSSPWDGLFASPSGRVPQSDLESPLPPPGLPTGTQEGDYELAPAPPDQPTTHYEMTNPVGQAQPAPPLSPPGYTPFTEPPQ